MNLGSGEVLVILLVALIVLGPTRLPEAARQVGKAMRSIRQVSTGFQDEIRHAMEDAEEQAAAAKAAVDFTAPPKPEPPASQGTEPQANIPPPPMSAVRPDEAPTDAADESGDTAESAPDPTDEPTPETTPDPAPEPTAETTPDPTDEPTADGDDTDGDERTD